MDYWITHASSLLHQIFLLVMAGLYALAWIMGISYKAVNIYCYFVFFPLSFSLLLRGRKKFLFLPVSLLLLLLPGFEAFSVVFFDRCVDFLNQIAPYFHTDYVGICVYICVLLPLLLYVPLLLYKLDRRQLKRLSVATLTGTCLYLLLVYPNFKGLLLLLQPYFSETNLQ